VAEERSLGGNLNDAVRVGDTVRRTPGPWTPAVHALLRYLEEQGFPAPRARGFDQQGREVLEYIEGEAHSGTLEPLPDHVMADAHVAGAGRLLRRYHDVVAGFRPPPSARWRLVAPGPYEVICHNDWSPWNALMRGGKLEVMLDWDLAGPGTRLWDVANAAYCWAPLFTSHFSVEISERARRLRLFLDAYGLDDRSELLLTLRIRLIHVGEFVAREAQAGDAGMQRLVDMNVPKLMFDDNVRYLDEHWSTLQNAL
jgi:aminoglycoside phosphotransferase (APT) family kinase protein